MGADIVTCYVYGLSGQCYVSCRRSGHCDVIGKKVACDVMSGACVSGVVRGSHAALLLDELGVGWHDHHG